MGVIVPRPMIKLSLTKIKGRSWSTMPREFRSGFRGVSIIRRREMKLKMQTGQTQPDWYTLGCPATRTISMVSDHSRKLQRKISARTSCCDIILRIPRSKVGSWGPSSSGVEPPVVALGSHDSWVLLAGCEGVRFSSFCLNSSVTVFICCKLVVWMCLSSLPAIS